jgi:rubredoxin
MHKNRCDDCGVLFDASDDENRCYICNEIYYKNNPVDIEKEAEQIKQEIIKRRIKILGR